MKIIYKYKLDFLLPIKLPVGAQFLDVQIQQNGPYNDFILWALIDKDAIVEEVYFERLGTGWNITNELERILTHVKTLQEGSFVWHIFKVDVK